MLDARRAHSHIFVSCDTSCGAVPCSIIVSAAGAEAQPLINLPFRSANSVAVSAPVRCMDTLSLNRVLFCGEAVSEEAEIPQKAFPWSSSNH